MTDVHYCPSCGLAFRSRPELDYHWAEEHDPKLHPEAVSEPEPSTRTSGKMDDSEVQEALGSMPGWELRGGAVTKQFSLGSFRAAISFVNTVADLAEEADHHPDLDVRYDKVVVSLVTHSAGGVTSKDLDMARRIEAEATP